VGELTAVARLYETGLKRRYRRASVLPGRGEPLCLLSDANDAIRELTRQVEQLRARVDAAEKLANQWAITRDYMMNQCSKSLRAVLTAPPSSSDPGRADTGSEER